MYFSQSEMGRHSGVLSRGDRKSHLFFRKISLATEWRRPFGGSRWSRKEAMAEPVRDIMVDSSGVGEVEALFGSRGERNCWKMGEWWGEDVGEEGNRGASSFLFHLNTWMGGGAIHGRSKVRGSRNREAQEFHFWHLRVKCLWDIQMEMSNGQTNKYEITASYLPTSPPPATHTNGTMYCSLLCNLLFLT